MVSDTDEFCCESLSNYSGEWRHEEVCCLYTEMQYIFCEETRDKTPAHDNRAPSEYHHKIKKWKLLSLEIKKTNQSLILRFSTKL